MAYPPPFQQSQQVISTPQREAFFELKYKY